MSNDLCQRNELCLSECIELQSKNLGLLIIGVNRMQ